MLGLELISGFLVVLQQTPREVTSAPPLFVTFPPEVALVAAIFVTGFVVTVGNVTFLHDFRIVEQQIEI